MDAIEKRARELLAAAYEADGMGGRAWEIRNPAQYMEKPDRRALGCIIAALTPPEGYVLVPVEPTDDMLLAAHRADTTRAPITSRWLAMLAARPEVL
ncbi:hypothetical protein [Stenotrophomonas maltophilia]|uniref:hypothetical protein n=1 Tax=Stenotrophomonas maltophilia TaxID=40324 RepID=UPI0015DF306C|nr:hypothetical protein [Stenotrophomonas maltophilia]MBA0284447.1 hypothetical protein [Stenotrophomonas maltophilia]MBA0323714.1 hypothetical protein [Stenotrophomonas maltophilia]